MQRELRGVPAAPIHLDNLGYRLGGRDILSGLSLQSHAMRIGVVGRNGSGKSTLAQLLAGLLAPTSGTLRIEGADLFTDRRTALHSVGILFQNPEHQIIFPHVSEEITFGLRQQGLSKSDAAAQARKILTQFDRPHWHDAQIDALSQGQKHLVCMMAVLAMRPRLMILDEPFAGLDIPTKRQLTRYLLRADVRLCHITHDPADLQGYQDLFWIDRGALVAHGPAADILPRFTAEMERLGEVDDLADISG